MKKICVYRECFNLSKCILHTIFRLQGTCTGNMLWGKLNCMHGALSASIIDDYKIEIRIAPLFQNDLFYQSLKKICEDCNLLIVIYAADNVEIGDLIKRYLETDDV